MTPPVLSKGQGIGMIRAGSGTALSSSSERPPGEADTIVWEYDLPVGSASAVATPADGAGREHGNTAPVFGTGYLEPQARAQTPAAMAGTMSERLTIPRSEPLFITGTRLMRCCAINVAICSIVAVSSTLITSGVITSATVAPM